MNTPLHICLLGGFLLTQAGKPLLFKSRKAEAVVAYLLCQERPIPRELLLTQFWPASTPDQAAANLRKLLSDLRHTLQDYLLIDRQTVAFDHRAAYWLDTAEFNRLLTGEETLVAQETAVSLYKGDFLAGFHLPDSPDFVAWVALQRERLRRLAAQALHNLANHALHTRHYTAGLLHTHKLLQLEPLREPAHRQMMLFLARSGRMEEAVAQYHACHRLLAQELGVLPTQETTALFERIQTAVYHPTMLPATPATSLVGRQTELSYIHTQLDNPACRLFTLVGPGGVGKTRLALQTAVERLVDYLHGVVVVSLTAVSHPTDLISAIANALNLSLSGTAPPHQQLLAHLRQRELLLLLDNCETLLSPTMSKAVELLPTLLQHAPQVKILATSRERLNLLAEHVLELTGLPVSPPTDLPVSPPTGLPVSPPTSLPIETEPSAIHLFAQRASLPLTAETTPQITQICQLVEGLPLAIELAATATRHYSLSQITAEIRHTLDFLSQPGLPDRHRSLRAVFESSWQHLSAREQAIFQKLSLFHGGFSARAAGAVAQATPTDLLGLVDKTMLRLDRGGRYQIHEMLRQYGAEKLAGQETAVSLAHTTYFLGLLAEQEPELAAGNTLSAITADIENIRVAWMWGVQNGRFIEVRQASAGLWRFYSLRGPFQEAEQLLQTAVSQADPITRCHLWVGLAHIYNRQGSYDQAIHAAQQVIAARAEALQTAEAWLQWGIALWHKGEHAAANHPLQTALHLSRQHRLLPQEAEALLNLGIVAYYLGDFAQAQTYYQQSLPLYHAAHNRLGESRVLHNLGIIADYQGDVRQADDYYRQALTIAQELGDQPRVAVGYTMLGIVSLFCGRYDEAQHHFEQARAIRHQMNDRQADGLFLNLGAVAQRVGDYKTAETHYHQAQQLFQEIGDQRGQGWVLAHLAMLHCQQGQYQAAYQLTQDALEMIEHDSNMLGLVWTTLGHILRARGQPKDAETAYRRAYEWQLGQNQPVLATEPLAGLAQVALAAGNVTQAAAYVAQILPHLEADVLLYNVQEPFWVWWVCYTVLVAAGNGRSATILQRAYHHLQTQAATIANIQTRDMFLNQITAHRQIIVEVTGQQPPAG